MKRCVYCKRDLVDETVIDVCEVCGKGVWGEKMFNTIKKNMENASESGSLMQGSVGENQIRK